MRVFINAVNLIVMARRQEWAMFYTVQFILHLFWLDFATATINSCSSTHAASGPFCWNPDGFISFRWCSCWGGMLQWWHWLWCSHWGSWQQVTQWFLRGCCIYITCKGGLLAPTKWVQAPSHAGGAGLDKICQSGGGYVCHPSQHLLTGTILLLKEYFNFWAPYLLLNEYFYFCGQDLCSCQAIHLFQ